MVGVALTIPGTSQFNPVGLDRIQHLDPLAVEGTLMYSEPRLWPTGGVPAGTVPNQSEWAVDLLGASAADLAIGNSVTHGLVERGGRGTLHVAWERGAGSGSQSFTIQNQTIRDHIAANPDHSYVMLVALRPTRIPAESWDVLPQFRLMGFPDGGDFALALSVNTVDKSVLTGYPLAGRTFVQTHPLIDETSAAAGVVSAAWSEISGSVSSSSSLMIFHNGGPGNPGMSWKYYFAVIEDLTVSGRTAEEVTALANAKLARQLAPGGDYYDDTVTDPYTL